MTDKTTPHPRMRALPGWAGWLIAYAATLAAAAGLVYFWRVAFALDKHLSPLAPTLGVMGVFSLLFLLVFALHRRLREDIPLRGAALIFACGLLFCFALAPLQAPDEYKHFMRANAISRGHFTYDYHENWPRDVQLLIEHFQPKMAHDVQFAGRQLAPAAIEDYRQALGAGQEAGQPIAAPVMFLLLPFLHQGLFMAAARVLGFSALGQMYAGRIANLVLYTLLCYFALRNARQYRGVLAAFMMLPLSLFMAASCSYDGVMLALCYLAVSYFCKDRFTDRDLLVFLAALVLMTYIKPNNAVLALVLLLIPKSRWQCRWKPWMVVAGTAAAALVFWWGAGKFDADVLKIGYPVLDRGSGTAAGPAAQAAFVLRHPLRFVSTALLSLYEADGFLFDLGRFGWMDMPVPLVGGLSVLGLGLAAVLSAPEKPQDGPGAVTGLSLLGLFYGGAVLLGMYVLDTDVGSIRITGQQPRYFLPAFLLLFLAGSIALGRTLRPRGAAKGDTRRQQVVLWVCAAIAVLAAILLFQNYFVGRWIPKSEGGWKMINLFGWAA